MTIKRPRVRANHPVTISLNPKTPTALESGPKTPEK